MYIKQCECAGDAVSITFADNQTQQFSLFWLRDHSTDKTSLNPSTMQRDVDTFSLPPSTAATRVSASDDGAVLRILWTDDDIVSEYRADFLYQMAVTPASKPAYRLWASELQNDVPDFDYQQVVDSEASFLAVLEAIEAYGVVTFSGMPSDMQATKKLLEQVGYIRETVFGGLWDFSNNQAHSDSAYTSVGIGLHTDGTYTIDPPGLQLLHCLAFDGEGGFNQFADGFKIAQVIKDEDPSAYQTLTQVKVPAHYIEPGIQLRGQHPVITENSAGDFEQICFNNYDRSPFMLSDEQQKAFYHAYGLFQKLLNDPAFQINFQLQPGRAVWFDNWRALHARTGFSGFRHLAGGYTNREDYISKLLTLRGQTPWHN
ncbi:trimethyllysine dioxygenase [Thalassotalea ponticola]|uniref:trimethyllysine dioxygenase n=1 Tax=Thalassotalea ponticola TaxID=1523392 RepID=UPI0025B2D821|nr:trimethyllysine dioxygenase [Thalassotalea ponticola]MDN3653842.1 trimethyllysine dioxygenase [Thalassotalea ponticola]